MSEINFHKLGKELANAVARALSLRVRGVWTNVHLLDEKGRVVADIRTGARKNCIALAYYHHGAEAYANNVDFDPDVAVRVMQHLKHCAESTRRLADGECEVQTVKGRISEHGCGEEWGYMGEPHLAFDGESVSLDRVPLARYPAGHRTSKACEEDHDLHDRKVTITVEIQNEKEEEEA